MLLARIYLVLIKTLPILPLAPPRPALFPSSPPSSPLAPRPDFFSRDHPDDDGQSNQCSTQRNGRTDGTITSACIPWSTWILILLVRQSSIKSTHPSDPMDPGGSPNLIVLIFSCLRTRTDLLLLPTYRITSMIGIACTIWSSST